MAKRKKSPDPHTELVGVRYTLDQRQHLEKQASPVPLSTYIRNLSLHRSRRQSVPIVNWQSYQELLKMSASLAQLQQLMTTAIEQGQFLEEEPLQSGLTLLRDLKTELKQLGQTILAIGEDTGEGEDKDEAETSADEYSL